MRRIPTIARQVLISMYGFAWVTQGGEIGWVGLFVALGCLEVQGPHWVTRGNKVEEGF